jgi:hypothetical protein
MSHLKKAFLWIFVFTLINAAASGWCYLRLGDPEFKGYATGTALSFILSVLWVLGAKKGLKSNTMVLLSITLGGFPVRLLILALFAYGGLYLMKMNTMYFSIAFLLGTVLSLIIEIWFFNAMSVSLKKKLK